MKAGLLIILLCVISTPALASNCIRLYIDAEQGHDALVTQKRDSEEFLSALDELEGKMFKAMQACPKDARIVALMAEIQITANQAALARLYAQKSLDLNPDSWHSQHAMGSILTLTREYDEALGYLQRASQLAPDRTGLKLSLCRTQALAGKNSDAIRTCTQVIGSEQQELHGLAYYLRGLAYKNMNETVKAQQDEQQARLLGSSR